MTMEIENHLFVAEQIENIILIRLKKNLIRQLTNLNVKESLFKYLHKVRNSRTLKVILLIGSPEKIKRRQMIEFLGELADSKTSFNEIARVYHAIDQLILFIRTMNKIVVHVDNGEVVSLFLNISLACDYRIIGERTVFQYPTQELGLVPKGGGIFFLSKAIGTGKTLDLMLSGKDITAPEALDLGLVNEVVQSDEIENRALEFAENIAKAPLSLISATKKLLNSSSENLATFLETENSLLLECIKSENFQQCLETCMQV